MVFSLIKKNFPYKLVAQFYVKNDKKSTNYYKLKALREISLNQQFEKYIKFACEVFIHFINGYHNVNCTKN